MCDSGNFEEYGESSDSRVPCHSGKSGNWCSSDTGDSGDLGDTGRSGEYGDSSESGESGNS